MEILNNYEKLIKYNINYNQVFYMYLISHNLIPALYKFQNESKFPLTKDEVDHLYELEYITEPWYGHYPDGASLTKRGKKVLSSLVKENIIEKDKNFENAKTWFIELFNAYPKYFNEQRFEAKGLKASYSLDGTSIEGPEGYARYYYSSIKEDYNLHLEILRRVEWAKEQNEPNNTMNKVPELFSTLASFIIQSKWQSINVKETENRSI